MASCQKCETSWNHSCPPEPKGLTSQMLSSYSVALRFCGHLLHSIILPLDNQYTYTPQGIYHGRDTAMCVPGHMALWNFRSNVLNSLSMAALLRYNSHAMRLTLPEFSSSQKETSCALAVTLLFPSPGDSSSVPTQKICLLCISHRWNQRIRGLSCLALSLAHCFQGPSTW